MMQVFDASFWFACCFFLFLYSVYKPLKFKSADFLDSKISEITSRISELSAKHKEAEALLQEMQCEYESLVRRREEIIKEANEVSEAIFKSKMQEIELVYKHRQENLLLRIQFQNDAIRQKIQQEILEDAVLITTQYLKQNNNFLLSDLEIGMQYVK